MSFSRERQKSAVSFQARDAFLLIEHPVKNMRVTDLTAGFPQAPTETESATRQTMPFDCYADNHSVPPKSCCPQEVRENLPQSFHSLAVSEPDPITLFTPYILSVIHSATSMPSLPHPSSKNILVEILANKNRRNFIFRQRPWRSNRYSFGPSDSYPFNTLRRAVAYLRYTAGFNLSA